MSSAPELTFKQYLESKDRLREAVKKTPQRIVEYSMKKYCKIPLGEHKDNSSQFSLKPKQKLIVEWLYLDLDNPTPVSITIENDIEQSKMATFWSGHKLQKWLFRNTSEIADSK